SGSPATEQDIVDALEVEFANASAPGTFLNNNDGTFSVIPDDFDDFTYSNSSNITATEVTESLTDAYGKIKEQDNDFYFVGMYSHEPADIQEMANLVQADTKIFGTSYSGADALDALNTGDIGSVLQALDLSRTFILYAENPDEYPEMAFIGLQAPKDPGSTTWKFQTVSGVTVSNLSTTQSLTLKDTRYDYGKGYNTYERVAERNIFQEGRMVNSEFIDIIRFADW